MDSKLFKDLMLQKVGAKINSNKTSYQSFQIGDFKYAKDVSGKSSRYFSMIGGEVKEFSGYAEMAGTLDEATTMEDINQEALEINPTMKRVKVQSALFSNLGDLQLRLKMQRLAPKNHVFSHMEMPEGEELDSDYQYANYYTDEVEEVETFQELDKELYCDYTSEEIDQMFMDMQTEDMHYQGKDEEETKYIGRYSSNKNKTYAEVDEAPVVDGTGDDSVPVSPAKVDDRGDDLIDDMEANSGTPVLNVDDVGKAAADVEMDDTMILPDGRTDELMTEVGTQKFQSGKVFSMILPAVALKGGKRKLVTSMRSKGLKFHSMKANGNSVTINYTKLSKNFSKESKMVVPKSLTEGMNTILVKKHYSDMLSDMGCTIKSFSKTSNDYVIMYSNESTKNFSTRESGERIAKSIDTILLSDAGGSSTSNSKIQYDVISKSGRYSFSYVMVYEEVEGLSDETEAYILNTGSNIYYIIFAYNIIVDASKGVISDSYISGFEEMEEKYDNFEGEYSESEMRSLETDLLDMIGSTRKYERGSQNPAIDKYFSASRKRKSSRFSKAINRSKSKNFSDFTEGDNCMYNCDDEDPCECTVVSVDSDSGMAKIKVSKDGEESEMEVEMSSLSHMDNEESLEKATDEVEDNLEEIEESLEDAIDDVDDAQDATEEVEEEAEELMEKLESDVPDPDKLVDGFLEGEKSDPAGGDVYAEPKDDANDMEGSPEDFDAGLSKDSSKSFSRGARSKDSNSSIFSFVDNYFNTKR